MQDTARGPGPARDPILSGSGSMQLLPSLTATKKRAREWLPEAGFILRTQIYAVGLCAYHVCARGARILGHHAGFGLYSVRRDTQPQLRNRVYADTRVMWFILPVAFPQLVSGGFQKVAHFNKVVGEDRCHSSP